MNWLNGQILEWEDPIHVAARYHDQDMALLYSSMRDQSGGETSYLALTPIETCTGTRWEEVEAALATSRTTLPDWIGYLGYGMRDQPARAPQTIAHLPDLRLVRYAHLLRFDHTARTIQHFHRGSFTELPAQSAPSSLGSPAITELFSNLSRAEYEAIVEATIAHIHAGDFYQANITRKFHGTFASRPNSLHLFQRLAQNSPAAYSAYIRHGSTAILSASPECFLSITPEGSITTRPIKGSARRAADEKTDQHIRNALLNSDKNRAENLMIVDLMRNDLARVSLPESVHVPARTQLHSYATIHHLISTVRAQKRAGTSVSEIVHACFPPGSMTGAPKIAAINWCTQQEPTERGVYSGAIGWLAKDACDLSVVIRTLIMDGEKFEFQVGGGIVADSTAHEEWQETLTKARGICAALGIPEEALAAL